VTSGGLDGFGWHGIGVTVENPVLTAVYTLFWRSAGWPNVYDTKQAGGGGDMLRIKHSISVSISLFAR
jgi:hypothetical protein